MNEQLGSSTRETLSALMDDEASELELHRVMRDVNSDASLSATWTRYHLAGSAMRKELPLDFIDSSAELRAAIKMALVDEPVPRRQKAWSQALGRMAVAASVAVVAIFGVQQYQVFDSATSMSFVAENRTQDKAELTGPQFQLPSGFEIPQATARTASTGSFNSKNYTHVGRTEAQLNTTKYGTDLQIQAYMHRLMSQQTDRNHDYSGQLSVPAGRAYQQPVSINSTQ